ncbi:hypothetical protein [Tahibacter amnicola]|uniref:Delta-60 repeat protein n=1 Tax=Tahibacter amnicola TaxID=2976241 RepID=A0ABY6BD73_9GAMM|nr:hypothetical protein [Tahibacter amnicola]UXI65862.1 hypothetical protein N4264_13945 [Tahibacter amnicola]
MRFPTWFTAALLACASPALLAHEGPVDPTFGAGGMAHYGFLPVNNSGLADAAIVACPSAGDTLTVVGEASQRERIVTARVRADGSYDTSFGSQGKASFLLKRIDADQPPGLCQSDGNLVVARSHRLSPGADQNIQIFRISRSDGQLDPGFSEDGVVMLDLDAYQAGTLSDEQPLGLNMLSNGDILVTGRVRLSTTGSSDRAFAARITATGVIASVAVLDHPSTSAASGGEVGTDGRIWIYGEGLQTVAGETRMVPFRAGLNYASLAWESAPVDAPLPGTGNVLVGPGRSVRPGVFVAPAMILPPGNVVHPALVVFRPGGRTVLPLPYPMLAESAATVSTHYGRQGVTVLPGGRVMYGAAVAAALNQPDVGVYFAMAAIGETPMRDRVEGAFTPTGAGTAQYRHAECPTQQSRQSFARMTVWMGKPVFVGDVSANCTDALDTDYLVGRIASNYLFADDFD